MDAERREPCKKENALVPPAADFGEHMAQTSARLQAYMPEADAPAATGPQPSIKLTVGLSMLGETPTDGEYTAATALLTKILSNVVASPEEPKFRTLRASNAKIGQMLATKGVRAILIGCGFVEEGGFLTMPPEAPVAAVADALARLAEQAAQRSSAADGAKAAELARRADTERANEEERKRMRLQISDDAAARKEPGWKAKAAGVKDGAAITGCSDIGVGTSSGG